MTSVISAVEAGTGVAVAVEALGYAFGNRVKLVRLTPEPKPLSFGIAALKGRLSPATEKFWQCAKDAAASIPESFRKSSIVDFIFLGASSFLLPACAFDKLRL